MHTLCLGAAMVATLVLASCDGHYGTMTERREQAGLPDQGNDAQRDGYYDGGVFDPDLTRRNLPLSE